MPRKMEYVVLDMIESAARQARVQPLNLGGLSGAGGGTGGPPGGFVGQLPQTQVTYDTTEAATLFTPASGMSLLDNLNHIRYRIGLAMSGWGLTVQDYDGNPLVNPVRIITFSGATITNLGNANVLVAFSGGGGGGSPLTVQEWDGSPSVSNVTTITFSGASVQDLGGGQVLVTVSGGSGTPLTVEEWDGSPSVSNADKIIFSGIQVADMGGGDALAYLAPEKLGIATHHTYYPLYDGFFHDIGSYYYMTKTPNTAMTASSGTISAETEFAVSVTPPYAPGAYKIGEGVSVVYVRTRRLSGTKNVRIKCKLYQRDSGGTETLLMTSEETPNLTGSFVMYKLVLTGGPFYIATTDRLVLKFYATPYDSGTNPNCDISFGNTAGYTRLELSAATDEQPVFAESNADDIFRVNSSSTSAFVGTINGAPSGATLVYNVTSGNENALVPASTTQLGKLRLYNTTRGEHLLILNCNTGTNTITFTANVPGSWVNGDTITIASDTVSGGTGNWVDIEIVDDMVSKSVIFSHVQALSVAAAGGTTVARIHPYESFASAKVQAIIPQANNITFPCLAIIKPIDDVFTLSWITTAANDFTFTIRQTAFTL